MGKGFKSGAGGGTALNFRFVGGTTQPDSAKENTIWVNTDQKITGWHFSITQPENMAEGELWLVCGASSNVAFNALKRNTIQVYPMYAKQWVSGALVERTAKTYQNGAWVDWTVEYVMIPGGSAFDSVIGVTKQDDGSYRFSAEDSGNMVIAFDATQYKSMTIKGSFQGYKGKLCVGLFSSPGVYSFLKGYSNDFADGGGPFEGTYDISDAGNVYFGVCGSRIYEEAQHLDCTLTAVSFRT